MTYFKNVQTLEALRKQYKELLKKYHPDNPNGSEEATKTINTEYEELFRILKDKHESKSDGTENKSTYKNMGYDFAEDVKIREMLNKIIHFENVTIEIIGSWIWIGGNTYEYRKDLKDIGFKWASQKKIWYWHSEAYRKRSKRTLSINEIRDLYGSTEVETVNRKRLAQA